MSLKAQNIIGGKGEKKRPASDLYPTPKEATFALLDLVSPFLPSGGGNLGAGLR